MIHAVAPLAPAFLVMATRIGAEENTARFQTCFQFQQYARQLLAGYMKQRGVGEYIIEIVLRQIELEEILLPHFAAAVRARHYCEVPRMTSAHFAMFASRLKRVPGQGGG